MTKKTVGKEVKSKSVERRIKIMKAEKAKTTATKITVNGKVLKSTKTTTSKAKKTVLNNVDIKRIFDYVKKVNKIGNGIVLIGVENKKNRSIDGLLIRQNVDPMALIHLATKIISPNGEL